MGHLTPVQSPELWHNAAGNLMMRLGGRTVNLSRWLDRCYPSLLALQQLRRYQAEDLV